MSPRRSISFDRIADRYEETRGGLARGVRVAGYLARHLDPTEPALEVGVGTGVIATAMVDRGFTVIGADLSTVMLARARHRTARVVAADAGRLPFADASFSQAYAAWVLHLVGDPLAVLREVARVLAPGGRFADVPGAATLEPSPLGEAIDEMEEILRARAWSQARSADGVIALGEQAGFRLIEHALSEPITFRTLPSRAIANIESRAYSYLWDLDDQTWAGVVEPALAKLRALPDEPVDRVVREHTIVLERV